MSFLNHHRSSASLYQLKDYLWWCSALKKDAITMTNEMNETVSNLQAQMCCIYNTFGASLAYYLRCSTD